MKQIDLFDSPNGEFSVWEEPVPDAEYIIGADIAKGLDIREKTQRSDHSTFCILKRLPAGLEQVAEGYIRCETSYFGLVLATFGFWYNTALLNPERNIAEGVTAGLMMADYPQDKWYQPPVSLSVVGAQQTKYFFAKTKASQGQLLTTTIDYCARGSLLLRSEPLLTELRGLQYVDNRNVNTNGKDRSIALMMGVIADATTDPPVLVRRVDKREAPPTPHGKDPATWKEMHGVKEKREEGNFYMGGEGAPEWALSDISLESVR